MVSRIEVISTGVLPTFSSNVVGFGEIERNLLQTTSNERSKSEATKAIIPEPITYSWDDAKSGPRRCPTHWPKSYYQSCKSFVPNRIFYLTRRPCPWHVHGECPHSCPLQDSTRTFMNGQELESELAYAKSATWDPVSRRAERIPRQCLELEHEHLDAVCPRSPLSERAQT